MDNILKYKQGEVIFCEYEVGDFAYIIKNGRIQVLKVSGDSEKILAVLKEGEIFGEMALFSDAPRTATAVAASEAELYKVTKDNLITVLEKNSHISEKLMKVISERIVQTYNQLEILSIPDEEYKIIYLLIKYSSNAKSNEEIKINLKPGDIARIIGISPYKAEKHIDLLQRKDLIRVVKKTIIIVNLPMLISKWKIYSRRLRS